MQGFFQQTLFQNFTDAEIDIKAKGRTNKSVFMPRPLDVVFSDLFSGGKTMETRVAVIGIIVEKLESVSKLNSVLHDFSNYIIGRMGIPYKQKDINIISVAVDAPQDIISALSGKLGSLDGVSAKTAYSNK